MNRKQTTADRTEQMNAIETLYSADDIIAFLDTLEKRGELIRNIRNTMRAEQ